MLDFFETREHRSRISRFILLIIPLFSLLLILSWAPPTQAATDCAVQTDIPQAECEALVALYTSTNGPSWSNSPGNGWNQNDSPCSWWGVICSGGHVTVIYRDSSNLNGTIPDLSALTNLQDLILSNNQLSGSIPDLSALSNLEYLSLYMNQLSGPIPDLSALTNLRDLNLGYNQLDGSIPDLSALMNLIYLDLSDNELSGDIPDLSALTNLHGLYLDNNQLGGSIPDLSAWTNLWDLDLGGNELSGSIPDLSTLTNLVYLSLHSNQLSGPIPDLSALTNLAYLELYNNQLSGDIPDLSALTNLEGLRLFNNQLTGPVPDLSASTDLWRVVLSNNQLSGDIPSSFSSLTSLYWLDLGYNKLTASDPGLLAFLASKDPDWADTQTVPPSNVVATALSGNSIEVDWTPISYTLHGGYYQVSYAQTSGGPYTAASTTTPDKTATNYIVTGLLTDTTYYLVVQSYTPPHGSQQNHLTSTLSAEVSAPTPATAPPDGNVYLPIIFKG